MTRAEEQVLVAKAQQDPRQFDALYRAFIDSIYRFVYYKTSSKEAAEDLTSQVFMHALQHLGKFHYTSGARFSSWLYAIARNQVIDHYRKQRDTADIDTIEALPTPETASNTVDQHLQQERVHVILQQLPELDQDILRLRLWEDKDYAEIGRILQINVVAVRARFSRAQKKFASLYTHHYGSLN